MMAFKAFNSIDSDSNGSIDLFEIKNWIELNQIFLTFVNKYEPSIVPAQDDWIFTKFAVFKSSLFKLEVLNT
jgi:hypothetical protein